MINKALRNRDHYNRIIGALPLGLRYPFVRPQALGAKAGIHYYRRYRELAARGMHI